MKLPLLSGKELVRVLKKLGFEAIRQRGSHVFLKHPDGRITVVPVHANQDIGRGLLRRILNDVDITPEELLKHRRV